MVTDGTHTGVETDPVDQEPRDVADSPSSSGCVDVAQPCPDPPALFPIPTYDLHNTFVPVALAGRLRAGVYPQASGRGLCLAHPHELARKQTRNERARHLHPASARPNVRPSFANTEKLRSDERRMCAGADARRHEIRPTQRGFQGERMGVCGRILRYGAVLERE